MSKNDKILKISKNFKRGCIIVGHAVLVLFSVIILFYYLSYPLLFCLDKISFRRDYKSCRVDVVRRSFVVVRSCHIYGNFAMG